MKVITVSRFFPAYHPKAGRYTYFVEKIYQSLGIKIDPFQVGRDIHGFDVRSQQFSRLKDYPYLVPNWIHGLASAHFDPKHHTIRAGKRFKTGEMASLRVWSGKPYHSPQIEFAQVRVTCFDIHIDENLSFFINGELFAYSSSTEILTELALNDGLELGDMFHWFKLTGKNTQPFSGQIICWNPAVTY